MAKKEVGSSMSFDALDGMIFKDSSGNENDKLALDGVTGHPRFTRRPKVLRHEFDRMGRPVAHGLAAARAAPLEPAWLFGRPG